MDPIDPALLGRDDVRRALAQRDISTVYRVLKDAGISQRQIANRTGQTQSEVSEILGGRRVISYDLLVRIAEGLAIPSEQMGLSYGATSDDSTYRGVATITTPEGDLEMLRRHLIAYGGIALTGATVTKLGQLLAELPGPAPVPLPTHLSSIHVAQVRDLTQRLNRGNVFSEPQVCSPAAAWATGLLDVPGSDVVRQALMIAVAELHSVAGWSAFDAGLGQRALYHHARCLELATEAGDVYLQALALHYAGLVTTEHGHPDDGLKMLQCAQVRAWDIPAENHRALVMDMDGKTAVEAGALADSATALTQLGDLNSAVTHLAKGRDLWISTAADPFGDMDRPAAQLEMTRGRLDTAEQLAVASVRRWDRISQVGHTKSSLVLTTVYVTAGDSRGLPMAHHTITSASKLRSVRTRQWLRPLADALDTRPGTDARDLARTARQVATTRPDRRQQI